MELHNDKNSLTRKEALQKMGTYATLTAIGTFMVLNPLKAQTASGPIDPGGDPFA
ncbi:MAG: Uncharacterised protein [Formosa sp. Hel1_33_131]|jgi:hypothetical protein|nr:MAG: Uncharacterised protein [Formosa sp. Hel1_33_131]|tara:strand:+ start:918 stop:1082 length:165 start_codon:yes stop_codon:yes gene_type:complete